MPAPVKVKNAIDTWVNQDAPTRPYGTKPRMVLRTQTSHNRYGFIYFSKPWPANATIISATLYLYSLGAVATSTTLSIQRSSTKWPAPTKFTYNTMPGVTGSIATLTKATVADGAEWAINVQPQLQEAATAGLWYGLRISTNQAADHFLHSSESPLGSKRPMLVVQWAVPPEQPDGLSPAAGRAVFTATPNLTFQYNDPDGDNALASVRIMTGTSQANVDGGTYAYDSGDKPSTSPQFDLASPSPSPAYTSIAAGTPVWWKALVKDSNGIWSPASASTSFVYQPRGTLTITAPTTAIYDYTPTVSWTFTGQTQRAYQVAVALASDPLDWIWDSGKVTSTVQSIAIPEGVLIDAMATYRIYVRVWDTLDREATPGQTMYTQATTDLAFGYDGTVDTHTASLTAVSDPLYPFVTLNWSSAGAVAANSYVIQRSEDSGTTWYNLDEGLPSEFLVSGSNYSYLDKSAAPYITYTWRVLPTNATNGRLTSGNPTANGSSRRLAPFLYRPDGTDVCCFINPERKRQNLDVQDLLEPLGAPPVLVTQRIGKKAGSVSGLFVDNVLGTVTAAQMYARFKRLRADSGTTVYVAIANETFKAVAYNMQDEVLADASGITYLCSFDWVEI